MSFRTSIEMDFFLAATAGSFSVGFFVVLSVVLLLLGFFGIFPIFSRDFGRILANVSLSFSACVLDDSDDDFLSFELELDDFEDDDDDDLFLSLSRLLDD